MANENGNGKVTLAIIKRDLEYIQKDILEVIQNQEKICDRVMVNEKEIIRIKDKQSLWNYGLGVFSVIVSAIAGFFGVKK